MRSLQQAMCQEQTYPHETGLVEPVETHISWLFLTSKRVYKIKKPVSLGFCDFSHLSQRRFFCHQEVLLNRRLAPETYLGVSRIVRTAQGYALDVPGRASEYAVRMRRLPREQMLAVKLSDGSCPEDLERWIVEIALRLASFHRRAERIPTSVHKDANALRSYWQQNFDQTRDCPPEMISRGVRDELERVLNIWLKENPALLSLRQQDGFVRDGHGDLHCDHICLVEPLQIIDCIEFNPDLRYGDILSDLSFLLMDLEFRGRKDLARCLWQTYRERIDTGPHALVLLRFYRLYRAWVRAKVHYFQTSLKTEAQQHHALARDYFHLACSYALPKMMILCCGLIGSGKSTLAQGLGNSLRMKVISSDRTRTQPRSNNFADSLPAADRYTRKGRLAVYERMAILAERAFEEGESLIIDATCESETMRQPLVALAERLKIPCIFVQTDCSDDLIRARLRHRQKVADDAFGSEAGLAQFEAQRERFEALPCGHPQLRVDTGQPCDYNVDFVIEQLLRSRGTL